LIPETSDAYQMAQFALFKEKQVSGQANKTTDDKQLLQEAIYFETSAK